MNRLDCVEFLERMLRPCGLGARPGMTYDNEPDPKAIENLEKLWKTRPLRPPPNRLIGWSSETETSSEK